MFCSGFMTVVLMITIVVHICRVITRTSTVSVLMLMVEKRVQVRVHEHHAKTNQQ